MPCCAGVLGAGSPFLCSPTRKSRRSFGAALVVRFYFPAVCRLGFLRLPPFIVVVLRLRSVYLFTFALYYSPLTWQNEEAPRRVLQHEIKKHRPGLREAKKKKNVNKIRDGNVSFNAAATQRFSQPEKDFWTGCLVKSGRLFQLE